MAGSAEDSGRIVGAGEHDPARGEGRRSVVERAGEPLTRRELLKRAGVVGTAAAIPVAALAPVTVAPVVAAPAQDPVAAPARGTPETVREALETLSAAESDTLEAIVARLIPTDEIGPGAAEARAAHYIDRALAGRPASARRAYLDGLAAVDAYAQASKGAPFAQLSAKDQDAVLSAMEQNVAAGFTPNSSTFFNQLRADTIDGTFCDPYYGGNANFIGWDLIGYPGVRMAVTANQQRMGVEVTPNHVSAYDFALFSRRAQRTAANDHGGGDHGA